MPHCRNVSRRTPTEVRKHRRSQNLGHRVRPYSGATRITAAHPGEASESTTETPQRRDDRIHPPPQSQPETGTRLNNKGLTILQSHHPNTEPGCRPKKFSPDRETKFSNPKVPCHADRIARNRDAPTGRPPASPVFPSFMSSITSNRQPDGASRSLVSPKLQHLKSPDAPHTPANSDC